jgi:hypothetical protein
MHIEQRVRQDGTWLPVRTDGNIASRNAQLVLAFGTTATLGERQTWDELAAAHPGARIMGCSTAGEIAGVRVLDDSLVATAITLDDGHVRVACAQRAEAPDCEALGALVTSRLPVEGLVHVLVFSAGLNVNGSALVTGIVAHLPEGVAVTGGLSADGARFERTAVCLDGPTSCDQVVAIGLYGRRLRVGYGSLGGWDPFGPERRVTRSEGNVLYELDGEPALDLYKGYLGDAAGLPASGLLFPLTIRSGKGDSSPIVRTILSIDEQARTLTFAGDVPAGHRARLMRANVERLVDGAAGAARTSLQGLENGSTDLALLISCVGRKLVLKQRVEEEVDAVREVLGAGTVMAGFYSYGEIAPFTRAARCELHNQTMTITTISER